MSGNEKIQLENAYKGSPAEAVIGHLLSKDAFKSDPQKAAMTIINALDKTGPFVINTSFRLPLGADSVVALAGKAVDFEKTSTIFEHIAKSVEFSERSRE